MSNRPPIRTKIKYAIKYWEAYVNEDELSVDWSEADTHCWRCGCEKNLQRCHIIPDSLGGKDEPSNIVLLCERCHAEGPNVSDPDIMWDWIKAYKVTFYNTFWSIQGFKEYEYIYKKTLEEDIKYILDKAELLQGEEGEQKIIEDIKNFVHELMQNDASVHFGQSYLNTATVAGVYRMMVKKLAEKYDVEIPKGKAF